MKNLKIKYKILLPLSFMLIAVMAVNAIQFYGLKTMDTITEEITDNVIPGIEQINIVDGAFTDLRVNQYSFFTATSTADQEKYAKAIDDDIVEIDAAMKAYEPTIILPEDRQMFNEISAKLKEYLAQDKKIENLIRQGQKDQAYEILDGASQDLYDSTSEVITKLKDFNGGVADDAKERAAKTFSSNSVISVVSTLLLLVFSIVTVFALTRAIARPIQGTTDYMGVLASGDLSKDVPDRDRKDEIGEMAMAIQTFKDNMVRAKELEEEQRKADIAKLERQKNVDAAIRKFELSMSDIVKFVASASSELQASAQSLSASAEETSKQSGAVAAASQQAAANVQTVASATEELSSSINEIASQVSRSSQVAARAVEDAETAGKSVSELVDAAQKIGEVTQIITAIAEQTNLLALNATIEAARAGDAGKGFAVVASEVKNLANESTKATEEISSQIAHIQQITQTSAEAIDTICRIIREIDEISGTISAAIQEQTSATQEISRNVTEAYTGTSEVTQNIGSVSDAANSTGSASHQVLSAADELSRQSEILKEEFDVFVKNLAAA